MATLDRVLDEAGGATAARVHDRRLLEELLEELRASGARLGETRPNRGGAFVTAAIGARGGRLVSVAPVTAKLRADPAAATRFGWLVVAALVGALVEIAGAPPAAAAGDLELLGGALAGWLVLAFPLAGARDDAAELATLAFEEHAAEIDRVNARAHAVPGRLLDGGELRAPVGAHPLRVAEGVARLGGRPAGEASLNEHEEALLALLAAPAGPERPHDDPDPRRRMARRILQRLDGMGKWGGYHTEFAHLARGFPTHERAAALDVGERLIAAGLLVEKTSVGQRHVFLNPRGAGEIRALIADGAVPGGLRL